MKCEMKTKTCRSRTTCMYIVHSSALCMLSQWETPRKTKHYTTHQISKMLFSNQRCDIMYSKTKSKLSSTGHYTQNNNSKVLLASKIDRENTQLYVAKHYHYRDEILSKVPVLSVLFHCYRSNDAFYPTCILLLEIRCTGVFVLCIR